jgi:hypothetical protein
MAEPRGRTLKREKSFNGFEGAAFNGRFEDRGASYEKLNPPTIFAIVADVGGACIGGLPWVAHLLLNRLTDVKQNYQTDLLRCLLELGTLVGVTLGVYSLSADILLAVNSGFISAMCTSIAAEWARSFRQKSFDTKSMGTKGVKRMPLLVLFAYFSTSAWKTVFTRADLAPILTDSTMTSWVIFTVCSVALVVFGQLFSVWRPSAAAGITLQDRLLNTKNNWTAFPIRSAMELSWWVFSMYVCFKSRQDILAAIQLGTLSGMCMSLITERIGSRLNMSHRKHL